MEESIMGAMEDMQKDNIQQEQTADGLAEAVGRVFALPETDAGMYSPLVLAYISDGVYELAVRTILVRHGNIQVNKLNTKATKLVKAEAQAALIHAIAEDLTPEEASVYRRGRNAKSYTVAKHATMSDYRHATGLEALCGYLYLKREYDRMAELLKLAMDRTGILEGLWDTTSR